MAKLLPASRPIGTAVDTRVDATPVAPLYSSRWKESIEGVGRMSRTKESIGCRRVMGIAGKARGSLERSNTLHVNFNFNCNCNCNLNTC